MEETTPTPVVTPEPTPITPAPVPPAPIPAPNSMFASLGPILALLVVLIVVIAGGLYVWGSLLKEDDLAAPLDQTSQEGQTTQTNTSPSDEINAIETDLNNTDLEAVGEEMNDIEAELDAGASVQ